jgi:hypothetical protein
MYPQNVDNIVDNILALFDSTFDAVGFAWDIPETNYFEITPSLGRSTDELCLLGARCREVIDSASFGSSSDWASGRRVSHIATLNLLQSTCGDTSLPP